MNLLLSKLLYLGFVKGITALSVDLFIINPKITICQNIFTYEIIFQSDTDNFFSFSLPDLWLGVTFAVLSLSGYIPVVSEVLHKKNKTQEMAVMVASVLWCHHNGRQSCSADSLTQKIRLPLQDLKIDEIHETLNEWVALLITLCSTLAK